MKLNDAGTAPSFFNVSPRRDERISRRERTSAIACDLHATIPFIISRQRFRITPLVIAIICLRKIMDFSTVSIEAPFFEYRQQFVRVRYISDEKKKIIIIP